MTSVDSASLNDQIEVCCPLLHSNNGKYGLPREILRVHGERHLLSIRVESAADLPDLLAHAINQYVSHNGGIYFKLGSFLTPSNIANPVVLSAFKEAVSQIKRCLAAHNIQLFTHEVVVVLQCLPLTQPQFYYYVVDNDRGEIIDIHTHSEWVPGAGTGSYDGPTQSVAEYWRHVVSFPAHRPCTQSVYDDACKLAQELASKSSTGGSGNISPEILKMLNVFERNNIDMYATFSIAKTMLYIFEISAKECLLSEASPQPTLVQSLMGFFSGVFGPGDRRISFECEEPDVDHPLCPPDVSVDPSSSDLSRSTSNIMRRTGWNNDE